MGISCCYYVLTIIYFCVIDKSMYDCEDVFLDVMPDTGLGTVMACSDWVLDDDGRGAACLYIGEGVSSQISSLSELFLEWYLFDSNEKKNVSKFLKTENLEKVWTEKQFMDLMCGNAYLGDDIVEFLVAKLPFDITRDKIYRLNALAKRGAYEIKLSDVGKNYVVQYCSAFRDATLVEKREKNRGYSKKYRDINRDEINARARQKRRDNGDEVRAKQREYVNRPDVKPRVRAAQKKYRDANRDEINTRERARRAPIRDEINARERERRAANIEHCRELSRANAKRYAARHPEKIREKQKRYSPKYYAEHKEELAAYKHKYSQEHQTEIADKKRAIRKKTDEISDKCPTFMFIKLLKKANPITYAALYGKYQNPALPAIKQCEAVKHMDFSECPILHNVDMDEGGFVDKCALSQCMSVPDAFQQIRQIAMGAGHSK